MYIAVVWVDLILHAVYIYCVLFKAHNFLFNIRYATASADRFCTVAMMSVTTYIIIEAIIFDFNQIRHYTDLTNKRKFVIKTKTSEHGY